MTVAERPAAKEPAQVALRAFREANRLMAEARRRGGDAGGPDKTPPEASVAVASRSTERAPTAYTPKDSSSTVTDRHVAFVPTTDEFEKG